MKRRSILIGVAALSLSGCHNKPMEKLDERTERLLGSAKAQGRKWVHYDSQYSHIAYPMGDVPQDHGVCVDVIIRAYRALGIDLQKLVHDDMVAHFDLYPKLWGLKAPDANIDHRRVPNLEVFFSRFAKILPISTKASDFRPGDIVTTKPLGVRPHISFVSNDRSFWANRPMVIQNMGRSVSLDDDLFNFPMTGHFRYSL